jgi:hypothetical protein
MAVILAPRSVPDAIGSPRSPNVLASLPRIEVLPARNQDAQPASVHEPTDRDEIMAGPCLVHDRAARAMRALEFLRRSHGPDPFASTGWHGGTIA